MEACGIDVYATARGASFTIEVVKTRKEKPKYFGLLLANLTKKVIRRNIMYDDSDKNN